MEKKPLGLYVHIPFCEKKCAYCDFLSMPASEDTKEHYVTILCKEIEKEAVCYPNYRGKTVFFGGGTPTTLQPEQLERILCKLDKCFSLHLSEKALEQDAEALEITLECNPGTVDEKRLQTLRKIGFNRLSIGLQSAQDEELQRLGRVHTWEDFLRTYSFARKAGFSNINVDLMSALPGQSVESYVNTIEQVSALKPEHISAYSLSIEEGTPFYERYGEADKKRQKGEEDRAHLLPTEKEERQMYELTEKLLEKSGYHRYEISNYALPGYECRHNLAYWKRENYLGLGLGAASLMENRRFTKCRNLQEYIGQNPAYAEESCLSVSEQMEEFMFLGLRLTEGISCEAFQTYFRVSIESVYGAVLEKLKKQRLLVRSGDRITLTKRGIDVSNMALAEFLL